MKTSRYLLGNPDHPTDFLVAARCLTCVLEGGVEREADGVAGVDEDPVQIVDDEADAGEHAPIWGSPRFNI
jgi:hypothetical protein